MSAATTGDTLDADGYTVTLDGGSEQALFGRIVFHRIDAGGDGDFELYVVNADGTGEARLLAAPATEDRGASWGPARE